MAVLEVKELTKKYGEGESEVIALDHVSFSVERGEFVAIIGASGSGKSTLMNMIGGIDYPTSGSIIIDGNEIQAMSEDELAIFRRRNLGIVYQFYNLIPTLTAEENIALPWKLDGRKENKERLLEILNMLGLEKRAKHLPGQMGHFSALDRRNAHVRPAGPCGLRGPSAFCAPRCSRCGRGTNSVPPHCCSRISDRKSVV